MFWTISYFICWFFTWRRQFANYNIIQHWKFNWAVFFKNPENPELEEFEQFSGSRRHRHFNSLPFTRTSLLLPKLAVLDCTLGYFTRWQRGILSHYSSRTITRTQYGAENFGVSNAFFGSRVMIDRAVSLLKFLCSPSFFSFLRSGRASSKPDLSVRKRSGITWK